MQKLMLVPIGLLIVSGNLSAAEVTPNPAMSVPAEQTTSPIMTPPTTTVSLSGKWSSSLVGDVIIEQSGDQIKGAYEYTDDDDTTQEGKVEGTIKGKTIQAKWWERPKVGGGEESRGDLEWKVVDDGQALMGWYRDEGEEELQDWNLLR